MKGQTIDEWLSKNVQKLGSNDCWNATAGWENRKGWHIAFKAGGKRYFAHRAAWIQANGAIPDGMRICHTCDNPKCCNPSHLFIGTQTDNAKDMWKKNRGRPGGASSRGCKRGKSITRALNDQEIHRLFSLYSSGSTQKQIAEIFGITDVAVSNILLGKTYEEYSELREEVSHLLGRGMKKKLAANKRITFSI